MRRASVEELIALFALEEPSAVPEPNLAVRRQDNVTYSPAIDGNLIPAAVADTVRERGERNVPFLGGGCRHEGTLFLQILGTSDFSAGEASALFEREGVNGARALEVYEKFAPGSTPREKLVYALTDTMFRNSMVRILNAAAESGGRCWSWLCTWETDHAGGELRASHAMELPFLWDWANNPDAGPLSAYAGSNAPKELGRAMREYWVRFARTGTPSAAGEPEWPQYSVPELPVPDPRRRAPRRAELRRRGPRALVHDLGQETCGVRGDVSPTRARVAGARRKPGCPTEPRTTSVSSQTGCMSYLPQQMLEGEIEDLARSYAVRVADETRLVVGPVVLDITPVEFSGKASLQEWRDVAQVFAQVELVSCLERLDAPHERARAYFRRRAGSKPNGKSIYLPI